MNYAVPVLVNHQNNAWKNKYLLLQRLNYLGPQLIVARFVDNLREEFQQHVTVGVLHLGCPIKTVLLSSHIIYAMYLYVTLVVVLYCTAFVHLIGCPILTMAWP